MILEVECNFEHFNEFLNKMKAAGVEQTFTVKPADSNSSFTVEGQVPEMDPDLIENDTNESNA